MQKFRQIGSGIFVSSGMGMGVPEGDEPVAELPEIFLHGKAAFLKNAVSLLDDFIDHVPAREDHIERYTRLFGAPDKGFSEKTDTVRDAVMYRDAGFW